ncbi:unnamed protein product [Miscanthus lutarioriparius]|uniref:Uncharacterized protein n=1 Tax=Miscanthus lutarioriparius TaxID=422564 RepID=A0A811R8C7_9POAL|nr:unnamed protein product [Miscanthus lutarioriparius]CAD6266218.1 unnamed protein product [Miscanthus lutarioriparius]
MASNSAEVDSDVTISDMSSSDVPVDEIPPPILDAQVEEVAMEQQNKEVEVPQVDSDATISDMSSSDVPVDEIPPPVLHAQEEVAMEQRNKEVEVPQWKNLSGYNVQDWRAFARKRSTGHTDRVSISFNQRYCLMKHTFLIADRSYMRSYLDESLAEAH